MSGLVFPARSSDRAAARTRARATSLLAAVFAAMLLAGVAGAQTANAQTGSAATAAAPAAQLDQAEIDRRVKALSHELRCLVCQNQTLADSGADLAGDLLKQVIAQVTAGKTDAEIKAYLVARYGDFVLYRPPLKATTAALWVGPFALLLVGAVVFVVVQRRQRARAPGAPSDGATASPGASETASAPATETEADRERAKKLLG